MYLNNNKRGLYEMKHISYETSHAPWLRVIAGIQSRKIKGRMHNHNGY